MWWLALVVVASLAWYSWRRLRYFSSRGVKTLPPLPFLGNLAAVALGRENFVEAIGAGYDAFKDQRYFGLYQFLVPTLVPREPELIRRILVRDFASFADRGVHIDLDCDPLFARNLIMLTGGRWRGMRAALSPAFSGARCRAAAPLMAQRAARTARHLRRRSPALIDVNAVTTAYVNDVIASCAFGFEVDSLEEPQNCIFRLGQRAVVQDTTQVIKFFGYENMRALMKLLKVKIISTEDAEKFSQLFKSALKARRENLVGPRPDFIQTLVDAAQGKLKGEPGSDGNNNVGSAHDAGGQESPQSEFTDDDLVAQAVLFYIAGYDTTANLINYFLYEMAVNPRVQEKLQRELDTLPEDDDDIEDIYEAVQGLEYLEMCVCEVLRLWPAVGAADRRSVARYDFGPPHAGAAHSLTAEAGIHVWIPIYSLHRDPQYWPEPDACEPERFAPQRRATIQPYTYLPFGTGPRHCIGSRLAVLACKVLAARVLRAGRVEPGPHPLSPRPHPRAFILRPHQPFHLLLQPRTNKTTLS